MQMYEVPITEHKEKTAEKESVLGVDRHITLLQKVVDETDAEIDLLYSLEADLGVKNNDTEAARNSYIDLFSKLSRFSNGTESPSFYVDSLLEERHSNPASFAEKIETLVSFSAKFRKDLDGAEQLKAVRQKQADDKYSVKVTV